MHPGGVPRWRRLYLRRVPIVLFLRFGVASLCVVFVLGAVVACTSRQVRHNQGLARDRARQVERPAPPTDYVLRPGDVVTVKFFYNPELNENMPIRPDGKVALQLVGDVQAAGQTVPAFRAELAERYTGMLRHPEVAIIVNSFETEKVYVGGEVNTPGVIHRPPGLTASQAIIMAGGHRATAEMANVVVVRDQGTEVPLLLMVDLKEGLARLDNYHDLPLQPRDIVFVPMSKIAEVNQFVDQYIEQVTPWASTLGVQYNLGSLFP